VQLPQSFLQIVGILRRKSWALRLLRCTAHIWTASIIDKAVGKHNKKNESRLQQILEMPSALITVFVFVVIITITLPVITMMILVSGH